MNFDQYEALTDLICFAYDNGYYHNKYNTTHNVFDDMADSVIGAKRIWKEIRKGKGKTTKGGVVVWQLN